MILTREQQDHRRLVGVKGFYFTGAEALRITSLNSVASVAVTLGGRFLEVGALAPADFAERHTPNSDRTAATSEYSMGEGWLQTLTLVATGAAPLYGQTFVRVDVIRGRDASATVVATLLQGFVTAAQRLAWPGSPLYATVERPGAIRMIAGTDPAAGADVSETVPTGARWRLISLTVNLATDATAANRAVNLRFQNGGTAIFQIGTNVVQAASTSQRYQWGAALGVSGTHSSVHASSLANAPMLLAGHAIDTTTSNLQAGDNYGIPQLIVEEWLEGA